MVSRLGLILILILAVHSAHGEELHVVFDLDGTLIQSAPMAPMEDDSDQVITHDHEAFLINDFAPEVIGRLVEAGYRISFFSGGSAERNAEIIRALQTRVHQRTGRLLEPYKILDASSLTPVFGVPESAKYRDRFRKNLEHVSDVNNVVLIDDIGKFAMPGQERNLLEVPGTINNVLERQKLLVVMEVLLEVRTLMRRRHVQFLQAVRGLAQGLGASDYDHNVYSEFMLKALRRFKLRPQLSKPSYPMLNLGRSCQSIWKR